MSTAHTPTPWRVTGTGASALIRTADARIVACRHRLPAAENEEVMQHIVRCVNAHDELVEALRLLTTRAGKIGRSHFKNNAEFDAWVAAYEDSVGALIKVPA